MVKEDCQRNAMLVIAVASHGKDMGWGYHLWEIVEGKLTE